ncbi:hypothetical protein HD806DRAFT_178462 [Xylariaceae sp. AK1471]|nr:hypothetical protein HD806DRAFT_178462 [Xylariaceae sp. AK1471]
MAPSLKSLLTPELFSLMVESWIPYTKTESFSIGESVKRILFAEDGGGNTGVREKVWPVLKMLSELGLNNAPDMMSFLAPVDSPEFPSQALGLQLLLDQGPRVCLKGVDVRWISGYFDEISLTFAQQLQSLPEDLRPSSWIQWKDSSTVEYFFWVRFLLSAPIVHHEKMGEAAAAFTEETRVFIEQQFAVRDQFRDLPELRWDLYGFPRMLVERGPKTPCGQAEGCFWLLCLMDVHKPPLDNYGRYPYLNWRLGRVATAEEEEWIRKAPVFTPPPEEITNKIREDNEKGIWTPLGDTPA